MPHFSPAMINERVRDYFQGCRNKSLEYAQHLPSDPFCDLEKEVVALLHQSALPVPAFSTVVH